MEGLKGYSEAVKLSVQEGTLPRVDGFTQAMVNMNLHHKYLQGIATVAPPTVTPSGAQQTEA